MYYKVRIINAERPDLDNAVCYESVNLLKINDDRIFVADTHTGYGEEIQINKYEMILIFKENNNNAT